MQKLHLAESQDSAWIALCLGPCEYLISNCCKELSILLIERVMPYSKDSYSLFLVGEGGPTNINQICTNLWLGSKRPTEGARIQGAVLTQKVKG